MTMRLHTLMLTLLVVSGMLTVPGLQGCLFGGGGGDQSAEGGGPPPDAAPPEEMAEPMPPGEMAEPMPPGDAGAPMPEGMMGGEPAAGGEPAGGGDASAMVSEGMQLKHAGHYAEARTKFEAAVAADASNLEAHWGLAWIYAEMADAGVADLKDQAIAEFNQVIQLGATGEMANEANAALQRLQ